ncbi:MAG TPA: heme lyase CcmF/NrfE family subunit [Solirubrobacterales bacterium]|nr:heme lyase CcmF/NrfE family subunit [Solirubrobacterales bacterium]
MITLGAACLILALLVALYGAVAALVGTRGDRRFADSARRATYAFAGLLTICVVVIEVAFARTDLSLRVVADHSSTTTPGFYKLTAMWSSQEGSLLLWAWVLSLTSSAVLFATRHKHREIAPWATAVLMGLGAFFTGLMLFDANPFARLDPAPAEGLGLNPLLRHPAMAIHPPMLYSGYVFFSIPFAFAIGALITRRLDASWIRATRRFALIAWLLLGVGILLGARWSYSELGWGGYWGWDPVENASLMPWLVGTAFLHSVMVQERRGILRVWNVSLVCGTFALALLGTFLVRSGILESIHAFGASTVGGPLLALITIVVIGSAALIVSRLDDLRSTKRVESLASREAVFLVNNLLLVGLAAVIFWGTFFPLIAELFTGERASLAAPWFNRFTTPLAILLVLFTGIGPLLAWRRVSFGGLKRLLGIPTLVGLAAAVALFALTDARSEPLALIMFSLAAFTLAALAQEFWRGTVAQRALSGGSYPRALLTLFGRNRRRYGGYVVHAGLATLLVAVAASSSFQTSRDLRLRPGQSATVDDYQVTYKRPTAVIEPAEQRLTFGSVLAVQKDGRPYATLRPSRNYYAGMGGQGGSGPVRSFFEGEATSEVGRKTTVGGDFWTAMQPDLGRLDPVINTADRRLSRIARRVPAGDAQAGRQLGFLQGLAIRAIEQRYLKDPPPANFRVNVNPLVSWIWVGGAIAVLGGLVAIWPAPEARRRRVSDVYAARLARELGRA